MNRFSDRQKSMGTWVTFRRILLVVALVSLLLPFLWQGIWLIELFMTGSVDDRGEFCDETNSPDFAFGAAKNCELLVGHIIKLSAFSYLIAFVPLLTASLSIWGLTAAIRRITSHQSP